MYGLGVALGYLVSKNLIPQELADSIASDPEIQTAFQLALIGAGAIITETCYALAKKYGWAT